MSIKEKILKMWNERPRRRFGASQVQILMRWMRLTLWIYAGAALVALGLFFICAAAMDHGHFWSAGWILVTVFVLIGLAIICGFAVALKRSRIREENNANMILSVGAVEAAAIGQCGVIAIDQDDRIVWISSYLVDNGFTGVGEGVEVIAPELRDAVIKGRDTDHPTVFKRENRSFRAWYSSADYCFFVQDITRIVCLNETIEEESSIVGFIQIDNFSEYGKNAKTATQAEIQIAETIGKVRDILTDFANRYRVYIGQSSDSTFILLGEKSCLDKIRADGYPLCSELKRRMDGTVTISVAIAWGYTSFVELSKHATEALGLCNSRGGDQLIVSTPEGNLVTGGDNSIQFSTRAILSEWCQSLLAEVRKSPNVIIVPPASSGFDELAATIALNEMVTSTGIPCFWVFDIDSLQERARSGPSRWCTHAQENGSAKRAQAAKRDIRPETLMICVGFSTPEGSCAPSLFQGEESLRTIIIKGRDPVPTTFTHPVLTLDIGQASCFSELVAGMIETTMSSLHLPTFVATLLYTGILGATQSFTVKTRANTFLSAAFLERQGAENENALDMLKETSEEFRARMDILNTSDIPFPGVLVCYDPDWRKTTLSSEALDAALNDALNVAHISAAFALSRSGDQEISVAGRGDGALPIPQIMHQLSRHTTTHGERTLARVESDDLEEVRRHLISAIARALGAKDPYPELESEEHELDEVAVDKPAIEPEAPTDEDEDEEDESK